LFQPWLSGQIAPRAWGCVAILPSHDPGTRFLRAKHFHDFGKGSYMVWVRGEAE